MKTLRDDRRFDFCADWLVEQLDTLPVEWIATAPRNDLDVHDWLPDLLSPLDNLRSAWAVQCALTELRTILARRPRLYQLVRRAIH